VNLTLYIGLQASGKSTFYRERVFRTHLRLNLDMLRTRHREALLFRACLESKTPFVVDNTNLTRKDRAKYIAPAREAGFGVVGYFFESKLAPCLDRNRLREADQVVPEVALRGSFRAMELPSLEEGFDQLWFVRMQPESGFIVEEWKS
jgi:predicted kinase